MADFCNTCVAKWAVQDKDGRTIDEIYETINPDIDVFDLFEKTPKDMMYCGLICEGCGLTAIKRTQDDKMLVAYMKWGDEAKKPIEWVEYPDLRKKDV
jgi:hypothetical protein